MMNSALNISVILVVSTVCAAFLHWFERPKPVPPVVLEPPAPPPPEPKAIDGITLTNNWLVLQKDFAARQAEYEKTQAKIQRDLEKQQIQRMSRYAIEWTDIL
jgi:hypothetical protein